MRPIDLIGSTSRRHLRWVHRRPLPLVVVTWIAVVLALLASALLWALWIGWGWNRL